MKKTLFFLIALCNVVYGGIVTDHLELHFKCDENTGTSTYDTIVNAEGTLVNGAGWTNGICGYGIDFTPDNKRISVANASLPAFFKSAMPTLTIDMWIYISSVKLSYLSVPEEGTSWYFTYNHVSANHLSAYLYGTGGWCADNVTVPTGAWTQVGFVYDGAHCQFFINGQFTNSVANTGNIPAILKELRFSWSDSNVGLNGYMDEMKIYSKALSAAEVLQNYNYELGGCAAPAAPSINPLRRIPQFINKSIPTGCIAKRSNNE